MRSTLHNIFGSSSNRVRENHRDEPEPGSRPQPQIQPPNISSEILQATPRSSVARANTAPSLNVMPRVAQDYSEVVNLSLQNLRIGNEPDSNLVNIPTWRRTRLPNLTPPHDEQTSGLTGIAFFEAAGRDERLTPGLKTLCSGRKLARNALLTDEQLDQYTEKIRFIASRCHNGSDEFKSQIDGLALEAQVFCGDRTAYFIEQMHGMAILDLLSGPNSTDEVMLFNLGVAFYKLDLVKMETCKRLETAVHQHETVEDVLTAEYLLQDELGLPVNHARPGFMGVGNMTPAIADEIKEAVLKRLLSKDGVYVIDFLSDWQPWSKYVENLPKNQPDFEELHEIFTDYLEKNLDKPYIPEGTKIEIANECMDRHRDWKRDLVGQKSREYLVNYRADYLIEMGHLPGPLAREVTR